jgi:hypothetical protein
MTTSAEREALSFSQFLDLPARYWLPAFFPIVQSLAFPREVIHESERADRGQELPEDLLAVGQGETAHVVSHDAEEVERIERGRLAERRALHIQRPPNPGSALQALEARAPGLVVHHDLSVDHEVGGGQDFQGPHDLGEPCRSVVAVPRVQAAHVAFAASDHAVPVQLELEQPLGVGERFVGGVCQHDLHAVAPDGTTRGAEPHRHAGQVLAPVDALAELLHG